MRRLWTAALVGGLLVCVPVAAGALVVGNQDSPSDADALVAARGVAQPSGRRDEGLGPPPWAHAGGGRGVKSGMADQSWKDEWHALTPAQRAQKMRMLARAHEEGMQRWTRCVRAAGADNAERRACERPLPPGLAKKRS